jgi:hypothetical protein
VRVITVTYQRGDEYDVERCAQALRKRWPNVVFRVERAGMTMHDIMVPGNDFKEDMRFFAEGFMASAHLWSAEQQTTTAQQ